MLLTLGPHVLEHGNRVGRLAGFELEPADLRIRRIIFSPNGELGPQAMTRPLEAVASVRGGSIELTTAPSHALPAVSDVVLVSRSTRFSGGAPSTSLRASGHGRVVGVDVEPADRKVVSVFGRHHWWSRRTAITASELDCSIPGELRRRAGSDTRAA